MGSALRRRYGPSRRGQPRSGRLEVNGGFRGRKPSSRHQDLLSGFERPSQGSLFDFSLLVRGALGRERAGPIAQLARARA
jgi:hypothetical protein